MDVAPESRAPSNADLVRATLEGLAAAGLDPRSVRLLVAVSGGADSAALAILLAAAFGSEAADRLTLAHVDHGWRDADGARRERDAVDALARSLGLRVRHAPPPRHGDALVRSEHAARRHRYATLEALAREVGATAVVTAHHRRDQAETVCLRARRKSGRHGLAGMAPARRLGPHGVVLVRPLLNVAPEDLQATVRAAGLAWFEDPANVDPRHDRARLRLERAAAPLPSDQRLAVFATRLRTRLARRTACALERLGEDWKEDPIVGAVAFDRARFASLPAPLRDALWRHAGERTRADADGPWVTRAHLRLLDAAVATRGAVTLPRGIVLRAMGRRAWLGRTDRNVRPFRLVLRLGPPDEPRGSPAPPPGTLALARIDADLAGPRPILRPVRAGDRFRPLGGEREVEVLDWLARRGMPAFVRARRWVVEANGAVAWVVGVRVDPAYAVRPESSIAWTLAVVNAEDRR